MSTNVNELFGAAADAGNISAETAQVFTEDLGAQIQAGLGIDVDEVDASEVVLVSVMPDDSGSIRFAGNSGLVCDGCNLVLESLEESKQTDQILVMNRYLNGDVLFPYGPLDQAVRMDSGNYSANKGTPLYDQTVVFLGTVLAKAQEFEDNGVACRTVSLIVTDGADQHSRAQSAASVSRVVKDMLAQETHIIAAMGIHDPQAPADFRDIFRQMGILDDWMLTPGDDKSEIRRAFQVFSQSAVRASQTAASFSQTAAGGFGS